MNPSDGIKQAWQASPAHPAPLPEIDELRRGADHFYRKIRRRNALEYGAGILVLLVFSAYALFLHSPAARLGSVMILIGNFFVAWQLHRRASALLPPDSQAGAQPILVHQRAQLARQRDALASVFTWYLLPFLPGLIVMIFAPVFDRGPAALADTGWGVATAMAVVSAMFGGIWWLNRTVARQLARKIDAIDSLLNEGR